MCLLDIKNAGEKEMFLGKNALMQWRGEGRRKLTKLASFLSPFLFRVLLKLLVGF